jgi:hypothetical protein
MYQPNFILIHQKVSYVLYVMLTHLIWELINKMKKKKTFYERILRLVYEIQVVIFQSYGYLNVLWLERVCYWRSWFKEREREMELLHCTVYIAESDHQHLGCTARFGSQENMQHPESCSIINALRHQKFMELVYFLSAPCIRMPCFS